MDMDKVLELVKAKIEEGDCLAASVLFGDEFGASDWSEEDAVECLFRYASKYGWDE